MAVSAPAHRAASPRAFPAVAQRLLVPRVVVPLVFGLSAFWFAWQASHVSSYIWLIDELLYVKAALGYAGLDGLLPHIHGVRYGVPNVLYMWLLAPLFGLLDSPDAFKAAHILNGILWASTLFPVYLIVRRLGAWWPWALLAGVMAIWVPWSIASLTLMTETAAYVTFTWALLAMTVAVAEPRPRNDGLAVLAIVAAVAARTQLVFLLPVFPVAIAVAELSMGDRADWRARLWAHRALIAMAALLALFVAAIELLGGDLLGGYDTTSKAPLFTEGMWNMGMRHVAAVVVGLGIIPMILYVAWAIRATTNSAGTFERAFATTGLLCLGSIFYVAAFFGQTIASVVQERYVVYAIPIVIAGAVGLVADRSRPIPKVGILAGGVVAILGISGSVYRPQDAAGAFDRVANPAAAYNLELQHLVPDLTAWFPGRDLGVNEGLIVVTAFLTIVTLLALAGRWRRWLAPVLLAAALVFTVTETRWTVPKVILGMAQEFPTYNPGVRDQPYDWIDKEVGGDSAGLIPGLLTPYVLDQGNQWMWIEFWNKSVDREYTPTGSSEFTGWPAQQWKVAPVTGAVSVPEEVDAYVVSRTDPRLMLAGEMAATATYGAGVVRPERPLRALWHTQGINLFGAPRDAGLGQALLNVYDGAPERLKITLEADSIGPEDHGTRLPWRVTDAEGTRRGGLDGTEKVTLTVRPEALSPGRRVVRLSLPVQQLKGTNPARGGVRLVAVEPA